MTERNSQLSETISVPQEEGSVYSRFQNNLVVKKRQQMRLKKMQSGSEKKKRKSPKLFKEKHVFVFKTVQKQSREHGLVVFVRELEGERE